MDFSCFVILISVIIMLRNVDHILTHVSCLRYYCSICTVIEQIPLFSKWPRPVLTLLPYIGPLHSYLIPVGYCASLEFLDLCIYTVNNNLPFMTSSTTHVLQY